MIWQDWIITNVQIVFLLALWPSLRSEDKPAFWTSVCTGIGTLVLAWVYATMFLWGSAILVLGMAYIWFVLAIQVHKRNVAQRKANPKHFDKWRLPWGGSSY